MRIPPKASRRTRSQWRQRAVGAGTAAGAILAFGITPVALAPAANADELEMILDPILNSLSSIAPALTTDLTSMVAGLDPSFAADSAASAALPASEDVATMFQQYVYAPLEMAAQAWIASPSEIGRAHV